MLIYLAQLAHTKDNINQNRRFPLACGFIAEYLLSRLRSKIQIEIFKDPKNFNKALLDRKPDIVMFSNYLWNENLACSFSKKIRDTWNDVLIVMGGPNLSLNEDRNVLFLEENYAIDKLVFHDGEIPSFQIINDFLKHKSRIKIRETPFLSTMALTEGKIVQGKRLTTVSKSSNSQETRLGMKDSLTLDAIPSPYLSGLFDKFFKDGEVPLIETNRGCPFKCSFCQQGESYFNKVRNFDIDRVCEEIEYIGKKIHDNNHKIDTLCIADPNFAMYKRDGIILEKMRKIQDKYGYPKNVICSTGKNEPRLIIDNASKLKLGSILLRSAVQSLDDDTLKAIDRSNIKLDAYREIQEEMSKKGLESNADLMLGLPKETKDSHFNGIYKLINTGVKEIACLQTIMLKGTALEKNEYVARYGLSTKKRVIPSCYGNYKIFNAIQQVTEFDEIIISNDDMSFEDYLECRKLHLIIMTFHNTRLLQPTYTYLDSVGIEKSEIIKMLYRTKDKKFTQTIEKFIEDTKFELFENFSEIENSNRSFDELTSNKIFRYLSISLYLEKESLCDTIKSALYDTLDGSSHIQKNVKDVREIVEIFRKSIISPFDDFSVDIFHKTKSKNMKRILGSEITLSLSEKQKTMLTTLGKIFSTREDKINRMAYHLKPANLSRIVTSDKITPLLGDSSEYVVQ